MLPALPAHRSVVPTDSLSRTPDYDHPPVIRVSLVVGWAEPLQNLGDVADRLQAALGPEWTERSATSAGGWRLSNVLQDGCVQVGATTLEVLWLGDAGSRYPHYETLRDGFVTAWVTLARENPRATKWSVTYVNRIPQGTVWQTPTDWSFCRLLPSLSLPSTAATVRQMHSRWDLAVTGSPAEISIELQHGGSEANGAEALWLSLNCHGPVADCETGLLDGLDFGRLQIVRTFREIMTPAANTYWGLLPHRSAVEGP